MKQLNFYEKEVYGTTRLYPDPSFASQFSKLTGTKTATETHLVALRELGFEVVINNFFPQVVYR